MLILPIRTETSVRHAPVANVSLITINIVVFLLLDFGMRGRGLAIKDEYFVLDGSGPRLIQFLTYQFSHADAWHLLGNMLFLWVFGNAVNAKLGDIPYVLFYLSGGVFSALGFLTADPGLSLLGASGSIAAVTTAYLVLFPRSHVTVLYALFFIGFVNVPATIIIGVKIILWDNVLAPAFGGSGNVAHSAHIAGYIYGVVAPLIMLLIRAVPRDQFDMLALVKRWNQRRAFAAAMTNPDAQAQARFGRVGRAVPVDPAKQAELDRQMDERVDRRASIAAHLQRGESEEAMREYDELVADDPQQCMSADQQMALGRVYYAKGRFPQAAATFERFLACYRHHADANEVRLLLGIIHARDLKQYESAETLLKGVAESATNESRREQARRWLQQIRDARGGATA